MKRKISLISAVAIISAITAASSALAEGCGKEEITVPVYCERQVVTQEAKLSCDTTDSKFADFSQGCRMMPRVVQTENYVCGTKTISITKMCPHG